MTILSYFVKFTKSVKKMKLFFFFDLNFQIKRFNFVILHLFYEWYEINLQMPLKIGDNFYSKRFFNGVFSYLKKK